MSDTETDTEIPKEIENPVTRRITLPLRYDFLDGAYDATKDTFSIDQAGDAVPFERRLGADHAHQIAGRGGAAKEARRDHWAAGLSSAYTTFFLSPEHGEGFYWGAGPVRYFPTATNLTVGVLAAVLPCAALGRPRD